MTTRKSIKIPKETHDKLVEYCKRHGFKVNEKANRIILNAVDGPSIPWINPDGEIINHEPR